MTAKWIPCINCKKYNFILFLSTTAYDVVYDLVKCECGLVFRNPQPTKEEITHYYQHDYFNQHIGSSTPTKSYIINNERLDEIRLNFIEKTLHNIKHQKLLDIGCGCGTFLNLLNRENIIIGDGIEPNILFGQYARQHYNVNVDISGFENLSTDKKYDIICLWHVINMVLDPVSLLNRIKQILKPSGTLFIELPNYLTSPRLPWKKRRFPEDPAQFFYFKKSTIKRLLLKTGFILTSASYIENGSWLIISAKHAES